MFVYQRVVFVVNHHVPNIITAILVYPTFMDKQISSKYHIQTRSCQADAVLLWIPLGISAALLCPGSPGDSPGDRTSLQRALPIPGQQ